MLLLTYPFIHVSLYLELVSAQNEKKLTNHLLFSRCIFVGGGKLLFVTITRGDLFILDFWWGSYHDDFGFCRWALWMSWGYLFVKRRYQIIIFFQRRWFVFCAGVILVYTCVSGSMTVIAASRLKGWMMLCREWERMFVAGKSYHPSGYLLTWALSGLRVYEINDASFFFTLLKFMFIGRLLPCFPCEFGILLNVKS